jgi:acetyl esterase/lipase
MVSREAEAFWATIRAAPKQIDLPLDARRAAGELAETATSEPRDVRYDEASAVSGLWVRPAAGKPDCTIVYLFGGGYVLGSPASRRKTAGHLALAANASVLVPNYRLAPQHQYPAAFRWQELDKAGFFPCNPD